ncbi:MAG: SRPBCC family protein [Bacteroidota bacterium]
MILVLIAALIVGFIAIGLISSSKLKTIDISKSVTINVDKQEAFEMVKHLERFPEWSPFLEADPSQKTAVKGTDGTVGAQYHWEGNKGKDLGYQEIVRIEEDNFIGMACTIEKPFKANPTFDYTFENTSNGTKVTQDFHLESGSVDAFFMWLFGAKKEMDKTNARGMELLKQALEK